MNLCACESEEREHGVGDGGNTIIMSDVLCLNRSCRIQKLPENINVKEYVLMFSGFEVLRSSYVVSV
jgi:hypothetical protein